MSNSITPPFTKPELIAGFQQRADGGETFWSSFSPDDFVSKPGDRSWSPAENVLHLLEATKPVVMALRLPRFIPRLLFGVSKAPSRHYGKIVELYHNVLAEGGQASGKYVPRLAKPPADVVGYQRKQVGRLTETIRALARALEKWTEIDLDRLVLPHPLLGKLSVREMLFFTLYHLQHHVEAVRKKST